MRKVPEEVNRGSSRPLRPALGSLNQVTPWGCTDHPWSSWKANLAIVKVRDGGSKFNSQPFR